ncbi:YpjP family protein [Mesobacillus harenae]|uniref:YpjP family protein n=1 Tax=Mesobacillus harenae TaxID=2213203 RepID=UPI0015811BCE|nr:YpjP family protein [Mesobacillus harenae]
MPVWFRKSIVVLITILSFGLVTPAQANGLFVSEAAEESDTHEVSVFTNPHDILPGDIDRHSFIGKMVREAEEQSLQKFGTKIGPVIEDEFRQVILPNIERTIETVAEQYPNEKLTSLAITEGPGGGRSEKIFNLTDDDGHDIIRFHVRRDQPPLEGYWFNFHYHTYHDQFQSHHELGTIYWDKNTPPNWRS